MPARPGLTTRWENPHLVTLANGTTRQLDRFGDVPFEVQTEGPPIGQGVELTLQVASQPRLVHSELAEQVVQTRQGGRPPGGSVAIAA